ncbi:MAG: hypothetical protein ALECFALPRED_007137 [Alectoria fallacina]|uniref:1-alkyl-2-acetylglycerophosphocholine esterase n=1 Tax=Alectoria fallacina TaxID=1903189 RepID=A0A8H3GC73_9LECA|nr:MAG: hypothetical protein ALECFALPRED_007137 [Alectoria fallacina]
MTPLPTSIRFGGLAILLLLLLAIKSTILFPKSSGPYNTRITTAKLVDKTRLDPFAPNNHTLRAIMVTVFYPINTPSQCDPLQTVDYMPPATAQFWDQELASYGVTNATLENFGMSACRPNASIGSSCHREEPPIVIFSPGGQVSRQLYSAMAQSVASYGYLVITIDHPYDAFIVEFPDGTLVYAANITTPAQTDLDVATRAQDVSFLLDQLSANDTVHGVIPGVECGLDVSRVAMFGHSFGGATTAAAMLSDGRIAGGVNMDGTFYGPVVKRGLDRPFLLFSDPNTTPLNYPNWAVMWSHLRGWKRELALAGSQHNTFSDIPLLTQLLGFSLFNSTSTLGSVLGTLDGERVLDVVTAYVVAFVAFVLNGTESEILQTASPLYPEKTFVD